MTPINHPRFPLMGNPQTESHQQEKDISGNHFQRHNMRPYKESTPKVTPSIGTALRRAEARRADPGEEPFERAGLGARARRLDRRLGFLGPEKDSGEGPFNLVTFQCGSECSELNVV